MVYWWERSRRGPFDDRVARRAVWHVPPAILARRGIRLGRKNLGAALFRRWGARRPQAAIKVRKSFVQVAFPIWEALAVVRRGLLQGHPL